MLSEWASNPEQSCSGLPWWVGVAHYGWLAGSGRLRLFFWAFFFIPYGGIMDFYPPARSIVFAIRSVAERKSLRERS